MIKGKSLLFILVFELVCQFGKGQTLPDGRIDTQEFTNILVSNLSEERNTRIDLPYTDLNATLGLNVFVTKDKYGEDTLNPNIVLNIIEELNGSFKPIGIQFQNQSITGINEYPFGTLVGDQKLKEIMVRYAKANTINLFLVDSLKVNNIQCYGYSFFPGDGINSIFLTKESFSWVNLATQLGHFFGLLSTHSSSLGQELVDGSNCDNTGDLICDTYADPGLFGAVDDKTCNYSGVVKDLNDEFFTPSVAYIMSDSPETCRCIFTKEQYRRMLFYYKKYRQYLQ